MPQLDHSTYISQLFWLFLTFSILYFVLSTKVLPAIRDVLQARQDHISNDLEKAEIARIEAEEAKFDYTQAFESARRNAANKIIEVSHNLKKEAELRYAELDAKLAVQADKTDKHVAVIKEEAYGQLLPVSIMLAALISKKLMGIELSAANLATIINEDNNNV